jgi:hypothetical protein
VIRGGHHASRSPQLPRMPQFINHQLPFSAGFEVRSINSERQLTWRTHPLILRSEAKSRVSKDAPEGGARTGAYWSVLRGRFAAPQDEGVGMKCAGLQNRDTRARCISVEPRSSLRANRSNPGERRAPTFSGLLRRCAPRNDDSISTQRALRVVLCLAKKQNVLCICLRRTDRRRPGGVPIENGEEDAIDLIFFADARDGDGIFI